MKIVALEPFLADLVTSYKLSDGIVGVSYRFDGELPNAQVITEPNEAGTSQLCQDKVDISKLKELEPDIIITSFPDPQKDFSLIELQEYEKEKQKLLEEQLQDEFEYKVKLRNYSPRTLEGVYEMFLDLASDIGAPSAGVNVLNLVKAQLQCWLNSFYSRIRHKKVTILASVSPLMAAGLWIPDMIHVTAGLSQTEANNKRHAEITWNDILAFRPDVLIVAPIGLSTEDSAKTFKILEKFQDWDEIPAVKRGDVYFTDGIKHFYNPNYSLLNSFGMLISAMAGLESGYITPRDSFFKLRWLEFQRHKF